MTGCINIEPALSGKAYKEYQNPIRPISNTGKTWHVRGKYIKPKFEQARHPSESENETYSAYSMNGNVACLKEAMNSQASVTTMK